MITCNATVWRRVFVQQPCMREAVENGKCCKHTKAAIVKRSERRQKELRNIEALILNTLETKDGRWEPYLLNKMARFVESELAKEQVEEPDDE